MRTTLIGNFSVFGKKSLRMQGKIAVSVFHGFLKKPRFRFRFKNRTSPTYGPWAICCVTLVCIHSTQYALVLLQYLVLTTQLVKSADSKNLKYTNRYAQKRKTVTAPIAKVHYRKGPLSKMAAVAM